MLSPIDDINPVDDGVSTPSLEPDYDIYAPPDGGSLMIDDGVPQIDLLSMWLGVEPDVLEPTYLDQDHDGIFDHIRWQLPIEQFPEHLLADTNWNGIPDGNTRLVDLDGDGIYETHLNPMDLNHDGEVDHWVGYTGAPHVELLASDFGGSTLGWGGGEMPLEPPPVDIPPFLPEPPEIITSSDYPGHVWGADDLPADADDFSDLA